MNEMMREKVQAKKEAESMGDDELIAAHSSAILRVEAMIREGANRLDKMGMHREALETIAQLHLVQSAHASLTAIADRAGMGVGTRSGER